MLVLAGSNSNRMLHNEQFRWIPSALTPLRATPTPQRSHQRHLHMHPQGGSRADRYKWSDLCIYIYIYICLNLNPPILSHEPVFRALPPFERQRHQWSLLGRSQVVVSRRYNPEPFLAPSKGLGCTYSWACRPETMGFHIFIQLWHE